MTARWLLVSVVTLAAAPAHAQKAEASVAFERGRTLMASGQIAEACAAFQTSMQLDPEKGTLYNLGLCHEKLGKLASAWTELTELAGSDANATRAKDAAKRAAALEPRLTRMRVVAHGTDPGLVVLRDKIDVTALVGQESPVDPGHYTFEVTAPGRQPVTLAVDLVGEGKTIEVALPAFAVADAVPAAPQPPTGYPELLALRPLVLPRYTVEVASAAVLKDAKLFVHDPVDGGLVVRLGLGRIELRAGFAIHVRYPVDMYRADALSAITAGASYAITPMLVGSLDYTDLQPTGGPTDQGSDLRGLISRKTLVLPWFAVDGRAGFLFSQRKVGMTNPDELALTSEGRAQASVGSRLSFEALAALNLNFGGTLYTETTQLSVSGMALLAVVEQLDVFLQATATLLPTSDARAYLFGLAWRTR